MDILKDNVVCVLCDYLDIVDEHLRLESEFNFFGIFFLSDGTH